MKVLLLPISILVICCMHSCYAEIEEEVIEQIKEGISAAKETADKIKEQRDALKGTGKAISPLINGIGKIAPFLGFTGMFFGVVLSFLPKEDSDELKFMKLKFAKVNRKLDNIVHELGDIKTLITYETQRSSYITAEQNIIIGFDKLSDLYDELLNTPCYSIRECRYTKSKITSKYLDEFIKVGFSLDQILKGSIGTAIFGEPILDLFKTRYKCEVGKLSEYMENIIRIATKGLQVKIATEKLTGSEKGMVLSTKRYYQSVYDLRNYYYIKKNECFKSIKKFFTADIKEKKYQSGFSDDKAANTALKESLEKKYTWLHWDVYSYKVDDIESPVDHAVKVNNGSCSNQSPGLKRMLVATPSGLKDIFTEKRYKAVKKAITYAFEDTVYQCIINKSKCIEAIEGGLEEKGISDYIKSISVMAEKIKPTIQSTAKKYSYIDDLFSLTSSLQAEKGSGVPTEPTTVRVVIMLRSEEMGSTDCKQKCKGGECVRLPFSQTTECQCKKYFDGEWCDEPNGLESSFKGHLDSASLIKIPNLIDMYYNVTDLKDDMKAEISELKNSIGILSVSMKNSDEKNENKLGQNIAYRKTIKDVLFYSKQFEDADKENVILQKELAATVLKDENMQNWIKDLNDLFLGSTSLLHDDEPLMITMMNKYREHACSSEYKKHIDEAFDKFVKLQQKAYILWEKALTIKEKDTRIATIELNKTLIKQVLSNQHVI